MAIAISDKMLLRNFGYKKCVCDSSDNVKMNCNKIGIPHIRKISCIIIDYLQCKFIWMCTVHNLLLCNDICSNGIPDHIELPAMVRKGNRFLFCSLLFSKNWVYTIERTVGAFTFRAFTWLLMITNDLGALNQFVQFIQSRLPSVNHMGMDHRRDLSRNDVIGLQHWRFSSKIYVYNRNGVCHLNSV